MTRYKKQKSTICVSHISFKTIITEHIQLSIMFLNVCDAYIIPGYIYFFLKDTKKSRLSQN